MKKQKQKQILEFSQGDPYTHASAIGSLYLNVTKWDNILARIYFQEF
jgi:hypothetical protein